jgi:hypothetical protein
VETVPKPVRQRRFSDKARLAELVDAVDAAAGIVFDPTATAHEARELMLAQGIRPEENRFSRDIIRTKYPDEDGSAE